MCELITPLVRNTYEISYNYLFVWLLGYLTLALIFGSVCRAIMKKCGGKPALGFALGFMGVLGLIVTICLASSMQSMNNQRMQNGQPMNNPMAPKPPQYQSWTCMCGLVNRYDRQFCAKCGRPRNATVQYMAQKMGVQPHLEPQRQIPPTWKCMCGADNEIHSNTCHLCGKPKIETFRYLTANRAQQNYQQPTSYTPQPVQYDSTTKAEHINSLRSLYEQGLISDEEFRDKMRELK